MTSRPGIHEEAAESVVSADRAAAKEIATRAEGLAPADIMQDGAGICGPAPLWPGGAQ